MIKTKNHDLFMPEHGDDVLESISGISENFRYLDEMVPESADVLNIHLKEGNTYNRAKVIWNGLPTKGGNVGWVNVRTGRYAPTWQKRISYSQGDLVVAEKNNGHLYECIKSGVSGVAEPLFPTVGKDSVYDHNTSGYWISNTVYSENDIVLSSDGDELYYYRCIVGGTSDIEEPNWSKVSGTTIQDGSASWQTYSTVRWREVGVSSEFREFGRIE